MMKRREKKTTGLLNRARTLAARAVFLGMFFVLGLCLPGFATEELIYEDVVNVGQSAQQGESITWNHDIPAGILDKATRVVAIVGARDVDYADCSADCPACTQEQCEHDRLSVNGTEIGLLEGENNASQAHPVEIPLDLFQAGANGYRVDNEDVHGPMNWRVTINSSTLRFYSEEQEEGEEQPAPAVELKKYQSGTVVLPGKVQTYRLVVKNSGETELTDVVVRDRLDAKLEYISSKSRGSYSLDGQYHTWKFVRLKAGASETITLKARVADDLKANQVISNYGEVSSREQKDWIASNTVTAVTSYEPVAPEDLGVTKKVERRGDRIGSIVGYRITIENKSGGAVFDLKLEDILPVGFRLVKGSVLKNGAKYFDPGGRKRLVWNLGTLQGGESLELRYRVVIGSNVKRGQNKNRALVTGVDGGGSRVNGEDEAIVMIGGGSIQVEGEIQATVFLDADENGRWNGDDVPMKDVDVILSTGAKKKSDRMGRVLFPNLLSGFYTIAIDPRSLPEKHSVVGDETVLVRLMEGERARFQLPVKQDIGSARLTGTVYVDKNKNGVCDRKEGVVSQVKVKLDGKFVTKTNEGTYTFANLLSGSHKLEVVPASGKVLERDVELKIGNNVVDIPVVTGGVILSIEGK